MAVVLVILIQAKGNNFNSTPKNYNDKKALKRGRKYKATLLARLGFSKQKEEGIGENVVSGAPKRLCKGLNK